MSKRAGEEYQPVMAVSAERPIVRRSLLLAPRKQPGQTEEEK
jgi:hypothetical protein